MTATTRVQLSVTGFNLSVYTYIMTVETTASGTYISNGNTYDTYNITRLTNAEFVQGPSINLISSYNGYSGNLLFDLKNMCFVPPSSGVVMYSGPYVNITTIPYSVEIRDSWILNYFIYFNPDVGDGIRSSIVYFYGTPDNPSKNYVTLNATNEDTAYSLLLTITALPQRSLPATPATPHTNEQIASMVSKQIKYQYGNKAVVKATGTAVTVTSTHGLTEQVFPVTITLPVSLPSPTFTFSEITIKDAYGNEQALDYSLPAATAGFSATMRKTANLANTLALEDDKNTYSFSVSQCIRN